MAEIVELHVEDMVPELEQMERTKLFTKQEIKQIVKKRKGFEYRIQRRRKSKQDYLLYIAYEVNLLSLLKIRRQKYRYMYKKSEIDFAIANRVNKFFKQLVERYSNDLSIWLSYIEFCKRMQFQTEISRVMARMLQQHSHRPDLWIEGAKWELEENKSVTNARKLLLQAIRIHPTSVSLYTEAFRLEILNAKMLRERDDLSGKDCSSMSEDAKKHVMECRLADIIYSEAMKKVPEVGTAVSLLATASQFDFTADLREKMIRNLKEKFGREELTWDTLARRELNTQLGGSFKQQIKNCCKVYEEAVNEIPTEQMWSYYIETLAQLIQEDKTTLPLFKLKNLNKAMEQSWIRGLIPERFCHQWIETLRAEQNWNKLDAFLKYATHKFPHNPGLWEAYLDYQVAVMASPEAIRKIFGKALSALGTDVDTFPLWSKLLLYEQTQSMDAVSSFFEKATTYPSVSRNMRVRYMEWLAATYGITAARKEYKRLCLLPPLSVEFHQKMAELELLQEETNVPQVRQCYKLAVEHCGTNETCLWMNWADFELKHGDPSKLSDVHRQAVRTLPPHLSEKFQTEYNLRRATEIDIET